MKHIHLYFHNWMKQIVKLVFTKGSAKTHIISVSMPVKPGLMSVSSHGSPYIIGDLAV